MVRRPPHSYDVGSHDVRSLFGYRAPIRPSRFPPNRSVGKRSLRVLDTFVSTTRSGPTQQKKLCLSARLYRDNHGPTADVGLDDAQPVGASEFRYSVEVRLRRSVFCCAFSARKVLTFSRRRFRPHCLVGNWRCVRAPPNTDADRQSFFGISHSHQARTARRSPLTSVDTTVVGWDSLSTFLVLRSLGHRLPSELIFSVRRSGDISLAAPAFGYNNQIGIDRAVSVSPELRRAILARNASRVLKIA